MNKIIYIDDSIIKFLVESPKYGDIEVIIDKEDLIHINKYTWHLKYDKKIDGFYISSQYKNKHLILSRIILNLTDPKIKADHINHNTLDNRKINLRKCNNSQNNCNKFLTSDNKSGYKGVSWRLDCKKWRSTIYKNNKCIHLGYFKNKIDAAKAYNEAAIKYHGEFAYLNKI